MTSRRVSCRVHGIVVAAAANGLELDMVKVFNAWVLDVVRIAREYEKTV